MKGRPRIVKKKSINTEKDPYMPKLGPRDMALCKKCGSLYHEKKWIHKTKIPQKLAEAPKAAIICPACHKILDRFAEGFITIEGGFLKEHRDDILNLIRNKEERASLINPLERIIEIREEKKKNLMEVTTTTEKLAQRIGQILKKTFAGEVEYKWSSDVKLARVVWKRPE